MPGESHGQRILAGAVHGVTKSLTQLSTEHTHICRGSWSLEKRFPEWGEQGLGNWEAVEIVERAPGKEIGVKHGGSARPVGELSPAPLWQGSGTREEGFLRSQQWSRTAPHRSLRPHSDGPLKRSPPSKKARRYG